MTDIIREDLWTEGHIKEKKMVEPILKSYIIEKECFKQYLKEMKNDNFSSIDYWIFLKVRDEEVIDCVRKWYETHSSLNKFISNVKCVLSSDVGAHDFLSSYLDKHNLLTDTKKTEIVIQPSKNLEPTLKSDITEQECFKPYLETMKKDDYISVDYWVFRKVRDEEVINFVRKWYETHRSLKMFISNVKSVMNCDSDTREFLSSYLEKYNLFD
jgi:hypothetical protein